MSSCKGCGNQIVWGKTIEGKTVPLDPLAPIYVVSGEMGDGTLNIARATLGKMYVSHFSTCPQANRFSGLNRERVSGKTN